MSHDRAGFAHDIVARLNANEADLQAMWSAAAPTRHCSVDGLLDDDVAREISAHFPSPDGLMLRSSLRERKRVGVRVDEYAPIVRDIVYAFQEPEVIEAVRRVTGYKALFGDPSLYAAGLSVMGTDDFLNPHIDNSHDGDRRYYRALNLLYYVSPGWPVDEGGNLELWDRAVRENVTVHARFNRLVIMETTPVSWHSVSRVQAGQPRYCVSNYFFSDEPPMGRPYRHVTTFTGRPEEPVKRLALAVSDKLVLNAVGRVLPSLTKRTKHRLPADQK